MTKIDELKGAHDSGMQWPEGVVPPELFAPIGTFGNKTIRRSV